MREPLFDPEAFEQLPGQLSMEAVEPTFAGTEARGIGCEAIDDSSEAVEARRAMFRSFGWSVTR